MRTESAGDVDAYIAGFPESTQVVLRQMREIIKRAAPSAVELISYSMPAYKQKRILVYFSGCARHTGLYPTASGIAAFSGEFAPYKWSKGAVQFPLNQPLPVELITRIVKYRIEEDG